MSATDGSVVSLWCYPVKSIQGEEINASFVTERGLFGDRAYALPDAQDGKIVTAKNPRKWPAMFRFRAAFTEPATSTLSVPSVRTTLSQADLPRDPGILRAAVQQNGANVGVYASVAQGGTVRQWDTVRVQ